MKNTKPKKINLRKTAIGTRFIDFLTVVGYSKESINKSFQNKLNPSVKDALAWEEQYNIPVRAWLDIKKYILNLIKEEEEKAQEQGEINTSLVEKACLEITSLQSRE